MARTDLFLLLILAILVIGGFASYWAWRLTKGLPIVLRLMPVALLIALTITPSAIVGHGVAIVPVIFVVIDSMASGNSREFYEGVVIPFGVVAGVVYGISLLVALIRYLMLKRKAKNVAEQTGCSEPRDCG